MNDEQQKQRIRIAETCGWTEIKREVVWDHAGNWRWDETGLHRLDHGHSALRRDLPNYADDLNAMHEAEESLNGDAEMDAYKDALESICGGWVLHASAEERARAFCMVLDRRAFVLANHRR
jgi:hypothetical protein